MKAGNQAPSARVNRVGRCSRLMMGAAAMIAVSQPALAQSLAHGMLGSYPALRNDDLDRISAAAQRLYNGVAIGTVERWRNPDSGSNGTVTLAGSPTVRGMACKRLDYEVRQDRTPQGQTTFSLTWCPVAPGEWKIVDAR